MGRYSYKINLIDFVGVYDCMEYRCKRDWPYTIMNTCYNDVIWYEEAFIYEEIKWVIKYLK